MDAPSIIECVRLRPGLEPALARFLDDLAAAGDAVFFHPHGGDVGTLRAIAEHPGKDVYLLFLGEDGVLAYGLLRGWNEGYAIPSLGIAVHPRARAGGLGRLMMEYLETTARRRNASAVRLRVHKDNEHAVAMYQRRGYIMQPDEIETHLLVGVKPMVSAT